MLPISYEGKLIAAEPHVIALQDSSCLSLLSAKFRSYLLAFLVVQRGGN